MGNFKSKIINNHVKDLMHLNKFNKILSNINTDINLNRYKNYLNTHGFYIVNINSQLLKKKN